MAALVFVALCGLSVVLASRGTLVALRSFSLQWLLLLCSKGSGHAGFSSCSAQAQLLACRPSCSVAYGIFLDQSLNLCPLHWQASSYPLHLQGSPMDYGFKSIFFFKIWLPQVLVVAHMIFLLWPGDFRAYRLSRCGAQV